MDKRERTEAASMAEMHAGSEETRKLKCCIAGDKHPSQEIVSSPVCHRKAFTLSVKKGSEALDDKFVAGFSGSDI